MSKFNRPGAVRIGYELLDKELMVTAAQNPDGSIAVVLFNPAENEKQVELAVGKKSTKIKICNKVIQTILLNKRNNNHE